MTEVAVSGAFHTPLMAPAQARLRKVLELDDLLPTRPSPSWPTWTPSPTNGQGSGPRCCRAQLRSPVRWRQSVLSLASSMHIGEWDGDNLFCELGPGGPLSQMVRATVP